MRQLIAPAGSVPKNVGSAYDDAVGATDDAESAIFTIDSHTGVVTTIWINTNGR
jgi:streptogramin lyase